MRRTGPGLQAGRRSPQAASLLAAALAAAALCALAWSCAPAAAATSKRTFTAVADASVHPSHPRRNTGASRTLRIGGRWLTYVRFVVDVPAGERILSTRLSISPRRSVQIRTASDNWRERRISWRHRPKPRGLLHSFDRRGQVTYVLSSKSRRAIALRSRERGAVGAPTLVVTTTAAGGSSGSTGGGGAVPTSSDASQPAPLPGNAADPSGQGTPLGDLPGWSQVFADDFGRDVALGRFPQDVADRWWAYPAGWKDSTGLGTYDPQRTVSVRGGVLNVDVHTDAAGVHRVAALLPRFPQTTGGTGSTSPSGQLHGRFSVRFRSDSLTGYKIAWLLWPDSKTFPRDGEIDFPEADLDRQVIKAHLHHQDAIKPYDQDTFSVVAAMTSWHTATTEWVRDRVSFYLDGRLVGTTTTRVPNTPMHWVLQTETNTWGWPVPNTARGNVQIDWVAAWRPAG